MTMENLSGFGPDPRDIAEDAETLAETLHQCTPGCRCHELDEVWGPLP